MTEGTLRIGDFQGEGPFPHISKVVVHGGLVYTSGVVADPTGDITEQTGQVLQRIDELLALGGTDRRHLLSAQVWLADINDFTAHNAVWDRWVDKQNLPVRACVQAALYHPKVLVEIRVIAAVPTDTSADGSVPSAVPRRD